jgi:hypothetical protein
MKIMNQAYEEKPYHTDVLGEAVTFIDWHRKAVTVTISEENMSDAEERRILEAQKLRKRELFRNGT